MIHDSSLSISIYLFDADRVIFHTDMASPRISLFSTLRSG